MNGSTHIMLVEDDSRLANLVAEFLGKEGFRVTIEPDGARAVEHVLRVTPDLVILDLMLPGEDGLSICRRLRPDFAGPILILTARGDELDQIIGLEMGADDYVPKPAGPRLLLARIRSLLRRHNPEDAPKRVKVGTLVVDSAAREARMGKAVLDLTTAEFELLWELACNAGKPLSREFLLSRLRGIDYDGLDRSIDVRISQLRKKLAEDPSHEGRIKTVRGVGYHFVVDDDTRTGAYRAVP